MDTAHRSERSYERIEVSDLQRLGQVAAEDRELFYRGRPEYRDRLLCVALCQGAGLHYVDLARGASSPKRRQELRCLIVLRGNTGERFPADRRNRHVDVGPSKFGRGPAEPERFRHFSGRRVDLLMRALPVTPEADPVVVLRAYLFEARTRSAAEGGQGGRAHRARVPPRDHLWPDQ